MGQTQTKTDKESSGCYFCCKSSESHARWSDGGNDMVFSGSFKKDYFQDVPGPEESDSAPRIPSAFIVTIHKNLFFPKPQGYETSSLVHILKDLSPHLKLRVKLPP